MSNRQFDDDLDDQDDDDAEVIDEENRIHDRLKDRILDARERVTDREDAVFVRAPLSGIDATQSDLTQIWGTSVRQYLKTIEPLLRSDEIDDAHHYYEELPILNDEFYPPDGQTQIKTVGPFPKSGSTTTEVVDIPWQHICTGKIDNETLFRQYDYFSVGFKPPKPASVTLTGLKDVIETDAISLSWDVRLNPTDIEKQHIAMPQIHRPLSKQTLEYAVRKADQFLQDAGISLRIDDPDKTASSDYSDIDDIDALD